MPQDPNDEPASALLERIKAEKARREAEVKPQRKLKQAIPLANSENEAVGS